MSILGPRIRWTAAALVLAAYLLLFSFNFGSDFGRISREHSDVHLTLADALLVAPFLWWVACSLVAFLVAVILGVIKWTAQGAGWLIRRGPAIRSPERRVFLERTATVVTAMPFVAGTYGLLYGRLNLETTAKKIHLA